MYMVRESVLICVSKEELLCFSAYYPVSFTVLVYKLCCSLYFVVVYVSFSPFVYSMLSYVLYKCVYYDPRHNMI